MIQSEIDSISTNTFLGWHEWNGHEVFGLLQKVGDTGWWFSGPGQGMSFPADLNKASMATPEEIDRLLANGKTAEAE